MYIYFCRSMTRASVVIGFLFLSLISHAQVPDVPAAFPTNFSCTPGQLLYREEGMDRITNIMYHNGHIYTNNVAGGTVREFIFSDVNDPGSLQQVFTPNLRSMADQGNHGHSKTGDYLLGYWRSGYGRVGVGVNQVDAEPTDWVSWQDQPTVQDTGAIRLYYPWSTPFNWLQYGATPGTARLYRADEFLAEWEPLADHGVAGNSILLGNILFVASDGSMRGIAAYDIGPVFNDPPQPPQLIDRLTGLVGGYLPLMWENYMVFTGGRDRDIMQVVDVSDPTDMRLIRTMNLSGTQALNAGSNVPYVQTQDQYVFARRHKIDMELLEIVLEFDEVGDNRPPGSVSGQIDTSQYTLPVGNLMISGGYSSPGRDAIGVWCHDAVPDNRSPYVGYHVPQDGQSNFPLGAPISLVIAEELESFTIISGESLIVRPVGGQPIDVWTSFAHDGILTITPRQYLQADTTYEVIIPAGGIKDIAGNGIEGYSFSFSTGGSVTGTNAAPQINSITTSLSPAEPSDSVTISVDATDPELDTIEYRFVFGDGTPASAWSSASSINHVFNNPGHYAVKVQVRDIKPDATSSVVSDSYTQTVAPIPSGQQPVSSSMLALDENARVVWTVNPDNDSVTRVDADSETVLSEIRLWTFTGIERPVKPVSVAVDNSGRAWIAARQSNRIIVLNSDGSLLDSIDTGYGSAPQAVLVSDDGSQVYVTLGARADGDRKNGQVVQYHAASRVETGRLELGRLPRAMALNAAGNRLFVAAFISELNHGEVWEVDTGSMNLNRTIILQRDRGARGLDSGGSDGPGVPNYIADLVISPDEEWLWYTAIKADTNRGEFFIQGTDLNVPFTHDTVIRSMLGRIDLTANTPQEPEFVGFTDTPSRVDVDNADSPSSVVFSPRGDYVFVTLQGNDTLAAFDDFAVRDFAATTSIWRADTGAAPQGSLFDVANNRLWVKNLMSRDLTVLDLDQFLTDGSLQLNSSAVPTVATETLSSDVLEGKRIFYFAGNDPVGNNEMSFEGYISCASCHIDGSHDGRTWDFTQRGEGFRNTTDLRGRRGMGHGNVHWTANFDEIQDFVLDIVNHFGGTGFLAAGEQPNASLGAANGGRSTELDQLSAYVTSLGPDSVMQSPYRNFDGSLSTDAQAGQLLFNQNGCAGCHNPQTDFTNSQLGASVQLHDVGTIRTSSGGRLGGALPGLDTPTLMGVWETAPFFHDGSAKTIPEVFVVAGGVNLQTETGALSGGASIPGFIEINQDSSSHGEFVQLRRTGNTVTLSNVDGGAGGIGALELRLWNESDRFSVDLTVSVNGSTVTLPVPPAQSRLDWQLQRLENINWLAGASNTVVITNNSNVADVNLDEIVVSSNADLVQANAHRTAGGLTAQELDQLISYVRSLDGQDSSFGLSDIIFANGFE